MNLASYFKLRKELDTPDTPDTPDIFNLTSIIQDQIQDLEITQLGEMHPYHTGTIRPEQFEKLDKSNL